MRNIILSIILVAAGLTACGEGLSLSGPNCSQMGEVCIELYVEEPVSFGGSVVLEITVIAEKDIPELFVTISHDFDVTVDAQGWEKEALDTVVWNAGVSWKISAVEKNRPVTFKRVLNLPSRGGLYQFGVSAGTDRFRADHYISVLMTKDGGKVYLSGTPIPNDFGPLPTMNPDELLTVTAWSLITPTPSDTPTVTISPTPPISDTPYPPPEMRMGTEIPQLDLPYPFPALETGAP